MRLFSEDMTHTFFWLEIALGDLPFTNGMQICNNSSVNQSINYFFVVVPN